MEQKTLDLIKIIMMVGLTLTMLFLGLVIWKYGAYIKANPCDLCDCTFELLKGGIK